jgi:hypothetical protein
MTEVKERPILFSGPMVRAILSGSKTQTRRILKPQPREDQIMPANWAEVMEYNPDAIYGDGLTWGALQENGEYHSFKCPYGKPGGRLWVREAHCPRYFDDGSTGYRADYDKALVGDVVPEPKWTPSIHMFRKNSRINLEITNIRVERLQDISEEDAKAEGVEPLFSKEELIKCSDVKPAANSFKNYLWHGHFGSCGGGNKQSDQWPYQFSNYQKAKDSFSSLWELINGDRSWDASPYVWVVEFKVVKP